MQNLPTPILNNIRVFDANYPYTFEIIYTGTQSVRNRLLIKNNETYDIVYDNTQEGLKLNHALDANILENNTTYSAQVQIYDANNNSSKLSNIILFTCHSTPQFYFSNVNNEQIVTASTLQATVSFIQDESDSIVEYKYYLYDKNKVQIYSSESFYDGDVLSSFIYYGLENEETYHIKCSGVSSYGFNVTTDYIKINIQYDRVPTNVVVQAYNEDGKMVIDVNIVTNDYSLENDNYEIQNGEVSLNNNVLTYHLRNMYDVVVIVKARNIDVGFDFLTIQNETNEKISLSIQNIEDVYFAKLLICDKYGNKNVICRNILTYPISTTTGDTVVDTNDNKISTTDNIYDNTLLRTYHIIKKNNLYDLIVLTN